MKKLLLSLFLLCSLYTSNAQWIELGSGANILDARFTINALAVDDTGNVYAATGQDSNGYFYVAKWNGTNWSEVGTGANAINTSDEINSIAIDKAGNIYAIYAYQYFNVVKWDGATWSIVGGNNHGLDANYTIFSLALDSLGNIYAGGAFENSSLRPYIAKWDGTAWSELGGSNSLPANNLINTIAVDRHNNVYTAGEFTDGNKKQFVAKYSNGTWSELGTGANALNANGYIYSVVTDAAGNVYAAGYFTNANGYQYVAKWDGATWSELGAGANALKANNTIGALAVDSAGNVYAAGNFTDSASYAKGNRYVAKWNGTNWSQLGAGTTPTSSNNITSVLVDDSGNVYAAGNFLDESPIEHFYVAEYKQSKAITGITNTTTTAALTAYPNPTTGNVTINSPEAGQVVVYNTLGELIYTQAVQAGNITILLGNAPTGIYTVIVTGQNNTYTPVKVVKN